MKLFFYRNRVAAIAMPFHQVLFGIPSKLLMALRPIKKSLLILAIVIGIGNKISAQFTGNNQSWQLDYTAYKNGKEVGWSRINISKSGNQVYLVADSRLDIQFLISVEAKAHVTNRYYDNILTTLSAFRTVNGKVKLDNKLENSNGSYVVLKGEDFQQDLKPITNTVLSLYLNEPLFIKEVFSEVYLKYIPVNKIAKSVYETPLPDGGTMTYYYSNGRVSRVVAKTFYGTVQFELNK